MTKFNLKDWIIFILITSPFIDFANGVMKFLLGYEGTSPGQVIRIIFLLINLVILMFIDYRRFRWIVCLCVFIGIRISGSVFSGSMNTLGQIFNEVMFDVKFLYFITLLMLILSCVKLKKISLELLEKYASKSIVITAALLILPTIFNIHQGSYGTIGSRGLFSEVNAIAATLLIGLGLQFIEFSRSYRKINIINIVLIFTALFLLGTKAALLFAMVITGYFFLKLIAGGNKYVRIAAVAALILVIAAVTVYFVYGNGNDILARLRYFYKKMNFMSFLISGRDMMLTAGYAVWCTSLYYILMGTGLTFGSMVIGYAVKGRTLIEMDFFDVYYFFGAIVGTIVLVVFGYLLLRSVLGFLKKGTADYRGYGITYISAFVCTALGGHVLFSPMAGMYFAILYVLNKSYLDKMKKQRKLRVIHAGPDLSEQGGVVTVMKGILALDLNEEYELRVLPTFMSQKKLQTFIKALFNYLRLCILKKPDILHVHMASSGSFYRKSILILISDWFNIKIVIHLHGACFREFYNNLNKGNRRYCRYIFNKADKVIVLTQSWVEFAESIVKKKNKIQVIPNFVKVPEKIEKTNGEGPFKILFLGRLGRRKGTYLLIKAAEILKKRGFDFKMILAGDGEVDICQKKIISKGLEDRIEITGWIDGNKKEEYLRECDVLALPSYFESFGMSLIEAMSYSVPVIAAKAGAMPEVVNEGKEGFFIEPGDYEDLAEALIFYIEHPNKRVQMGARGYERVKNDFSEDSASQKLDEIYKELGM